MATPPPLDERGAALPTTAEAGAFVAALGHEVVNRLAIMAGLAEALLAGDVGALNASQREYAQAIFDTTRETSRLLALLAELNRLESGRVIPAPEPFALAAALADRAEQLEFDLLADGRVCRVVLAPLPRVLADASLLTRALELLFLHVSLATPRDAILHIDARPTDDSVTVGFSLDGPGDSAVAAEIPAFLPPPTLVSGPTRRLDEAALRLALVAAIARLHGGALTTRETPAPAITLTLRGEKG